MMSNDHYHVLVLYDDERREMMGTVEMLLPEIQAVLFGAREDGDVHFTVTLCDDPTCWPINDNE